MGVGWQESGCVGISSFGFFVCKRRERIRIVPVIPFTHLGNDEKYFLNHKNKDGKTNSKEIKAKNNNNMEYTVFGLHTGQTTQNKGNV